MTSSKLLLRCRLDCTSPFSKIWLPCTPSCCPTTPLPSSCSELSEGLSPKHWSVSHSVTYLTLYHSMDYSLPGSSVHGILQAITLEWVAIPFCRGSYPLRDRTWVSHIAGGSLLSEPPGQPSLKLQCSVSPQLKRKLTALMLCVFISVNILITPFMICLPSPFHHSCLWTWRSR